MQKERGKKIKEEKIWIQISQANVVCLYFLEIHKNVIKKFMSKTRDIFWTNLEFIMEHHSQ